MKLAAAIIAILVVAGLVVMFLFRRNPDDGSETIDVDGMKVTIGPAVEMSGPEFLAMVEAQGGDPDPDAEYLYVEIPDPVGPLERGEKYEDPLEGTLSEQSLGTVTGGGSMMNADKTIDYVGLDVTVYDLEKSLPVIAAKMRELGAPKGTVIRYGDDDTAPYDIWENQ